MADSMFTAMIAGFSTEHVQATLEKARAHTDQYGSVIADIEKELEKRERNKSE